MDPEAERGEGPVERTETRSADERGPEVGRRAGASAGRTIGVVLAVSVSAALLTAPAPPDLRPTELVIAPDVSARLEVLAAGLHREVVMCLVGKVRGGTARAEKLHMPVPHASTQTQVVTGPCPRGTVATWHNHPSGATRSGGPPWHARGKGRLANGPDAFSNESWGAADGPSSCQPSRRDVATAVRLRIPFLVIGDGAGNHCVHPLARLEAIQD